MSYARFKRGESDVYIIANVSGYFTCYENPIFECETAAEMIEHILEHVARGNLVPARTLTQLREDDTPAFDEYMKSIRDNGWDERIARPGHE